MAADTPTPPRASPSFAPYRKWGIGLNVALVLLAVLEGSSQDLYGYEIAKRLQRANEGKPLFKEGTIYPVLRTLAAGGLQTLLRSFSI